MTDPESSQGCDHTPPSPASDLLEFEGWLDHVSLTLTMNCSRQELLAALEAQSQDQPFSELCRTYVHELAHVGQTLGTTLGYYTWMLRSVQVDYVIRMLKWLVQEAKAPIRSPLIKYLPSLSAYDDKAAGLVHGWQITESLITEVAGSVNNPFHAAAQPAALITPWQRQWSRLQSNILELYETATQRFPDQFFLALHSEKFVEAPEEYMAMLMTLPTTGMFTIAGVMESAALAVELSPEDDRGLRAILDEPQHGMEVIESVGLLHRTRRAYPDLPARRLLATHIAACDAALNPPCLPQHYLDRQGANVTELHPMARIVEIWLTLGDRIRPAQDIDDALRCADDICATLGWTTVSDTLARAAASFRGNGADPRGRAFAKAMWGRTVYPPLLHNPWVPIWGTGPLVDTYNAELVPAFFVLDDVSVPGSPERSDGLLLQSLRDQWTRSMMIGKPAVLRSPVPLPDDTLNHYQSRLAREFSVSIGKEFRPPSVKNSTPGF
ncbi:hypothetical protein ACFS5L_22740 [Streptomyces phyllanthi]|uniref:Uncharacterized protein n=1 Tax=Streptomyces phyllanthi TaxID=1803180 RepID=A0A5N8W8N7_9ACTN|nr:hypothetical protein [Streptomyces phyllanthi]MPY43841.1 hypothetical protein [Streptomyces phyllanthi]